MKELGGYSTDDAKKFRTGVASQEEGKEKSWKENNGFIQDKNVPFGWKIMRFQSSNGQARIISRAPDGSKFKGLIPALQHMIKADYPKEDIELLANNLNQIDWLKNPNIPEGWHLKMKKRKGETGYQMWYLTPTFELIKSTKGALDFIISHVFFYVWYITMRRF